MENAFVFKDISINLADEVNPSKFLALRATASKAKDIKMLFLEFGYDLKKVPGAFLKMFTLNDKEMEELESVLTEIDGLKLGNLELRTVFNNNLSVLAFKRVFLERVKYCLDNKVPFLREDNTFIKELYDTEAFAHYTAKATRLEDVKTVQEVEAKKDMPMLDFEDFEVKNEILKTLTEISRNASDPSITFIVSTIMNNLDEVIAKDNKAYKIVGIRHLVEDALQGINLDGELQYLIDNEILKAFPNVTSERGL